MVGNNSERPSKKAKLSSNTKPTRPPKSAFKNSSTARAQKPKSKEVIVKPRVQLEHVAKHYEKSVVSKGKRKASDVEEQEGDAESVISDSDWTVSKLPSTFKVVAGSYEKLLYGLEGSFSYEGEEGARTLKVEFKPIFIFPAHVACVKAVAASPVGGKWLATGSSDEIIKVWDLRRRKEMGNLIQHEGAPCNCHYSFLRLR